MVSTTVWVLMLALAAPVAASGTQSAAAVRDLTETADAWADLGNWQRAAEHYRRALARAPQRSSIRLKLARGLARLGDRAGALAQIGKLEQAGQLSAAAAALAGTVELDAERLAAACTWFDRALEQEARHEQGLYGAGRCHHRLFERDAGDAHEPLALKHYRAYLAHHPQGRYSRTVSDALRQLELGPAGEQLERAEEQMAQGKYRLAVRTLRQVTAANPDLEQAQYLLGVALASPVVDDIDGALAAWRRAPSVKQARLRLGVYAYEDDDPPEAFEQLEAALAIDPEYAAVWYNLGLVHMQQIGARDEDHRRVASQAFRKAMALAPKSRLAERASSKLQLLTGQVNYLAESEVIDTASEVQLGRKLTAQIEKRFGVVQDEKIRTRLQRILRQVAAHSERLSGMMPYRLKVLDVDGINALSFTGGTIYLYRGLLDFVRVELGDSDDALAIVIAHEVVHVDRRHGLGMLELVGGARQLMEGHSLNVRSLQNLMLGMSRRHEFEADQIGALFAYRAGFDPSAAYRFHRRMIATGHEVPEGRDHPAHLERAERLKEYLLGLRARTRSFDRGLRCIDEGAYADAVRHLEVFLAVFPRNLAGRNNLAVALHRLAMRKRVGEHAYKLSTDLDPRSRVRRVRVRAAADQAEKGAFSPDRARMLEAAAHFEAVLERDPAYLPARVNLGACLLALGEHQAARQAFDRALQQQATPALRNNLAVAELIGGQQQAGLKRLRSLAKEHPGFADAYFNLGAAHAAAGDAGAARKMYLAYLDRDDESGWAETARQRLKALAQGQPESDSD